jgi:hypothetical protein
MMAQFSTAASAVDADGCLGMLQTVSAAHQPASRILHLEQQQQLHGGTAAERARQHRISLCQLAETTRQQDAQKDSVTPRLQWQWQSGSQSLSARQQQHAAAVCSFPPVLQETLLPALC